MKPLQLFATLVLGAVACTSEDSLTQPGSGGEPSLAATATAANSWSTRAAYPGPGRIGGSVAMAPNAAGQSIVYYLGGTAEEFAPARPVLAYNVATDTWSTKASMVDEVRETNGAVRIGNRIYFSGGSDRQGYSNKLWAYDYTRDRLIRKADMPIFNSWGVSGVIDGKLYVLPGICSTDRFPEPGHCSNTISRRFFRYDPTTDRWVTRPWAPHYHTAGAAGVIDGKFYVAGGAGVSDLDVYDPVTNTWKTLAPIPTGGMTMGGAVLGGKLIVLTGRYGDTGLRTYEYTPRTNVWKALAAPAMPHDGVVRVTLGGRSYLFAVGDRHGAAFDTPNASELYTP
jgi:N-acetylneuraminic acid mutarotase